MRKLIILWLVIIVCFTSMTSVDASSSKRYLISINGQVIESDVSPINRNGSIFVPMRAIFEALKAKVSYVPDEQKVVGKRGNMTLEMWIGRTDIRLDGKLLTIQQAPFIMNNRVYVPVRVISESLGAHVKWIKNSQTVEVESSLLTHRDKLSIVNDRDQAIILEHNGNMNLKWSYQDESPFQMFDGYVAGEDSYIFKGFNEAYVMNSNGDIKEEWALTENYSSVVKAYLFPDTNKAKIVGSNPRNTWNSIPLLRDEHDYFYNTSPISITVIEPAAIIDNSDNLIITTVEGLTAYAPDGNKLWSHKEWFFEDQIISALQQPYRMMTDVLERLYIFYWDRTVILSKDGKLLTSVEDSYFNLYPMQNGLILSNSGVYKLSDNGEFKAVFHAAVADNDHFAVTEQDVTHLEDNERDVLWSYKLPTYEYNKGQRIFESSFVVDLEGNTYLSTQAGTVYALNSEGELMFKLIVDQRIISVSQIIPVSEHELIIVNDNAIFFFEIY